MPVATRPSLRPHRDDILRDCATGASGAAGESPLSGELPRLLDELSEWLEGDEPPAALAARSAAWPCATDRIDDPTRLARAIRELASLRAAILRHAGTAPRAAEDGGAAATSRADVRRLDAGLDGLVADAFERWGARRARALEAARREQEDSRAAATPYGELVRISPDAVFVNRGGRIEFVNPAAVELFGAKSPSSSSGDRRSSCSTPTTTR